MEYSSKNINMDEIKKLFKEKPKETIAKMENNRNLSHWDIYTFLLRIDDDLAQSYFDKNFYVVEHEVYDIETGNCVGEV